MTLPDTLATGPLVSTLQGSHLALRSFAVPTPAAPQEPSSSGRDRATQPSSSLIPTFRRMISRISVRGEINNMESRQRSGSSSVGRRPSVFGGGLFRLPSHKRSGRASRGPTNNPSRRGTDDSGYGVSMRSLPGRVASRRVTGDEASTKEHSARSLPNQLGSRRGTEERSVRSTVLSRRPTDEQSVRNISRRPTDETIRPGPHSMATSGRTLASVVSGASNTRTQPSQTGADIIAAHLSALSASSSPVREVRRAPSLPNRTAPGSFTRRRQQHETTRRSSVDSPFIGRGSVPFGRSKVASDVPLSALDCYGDGVASDS